WGVTGAWSRTLVFNLDTAPPPAPVLTAPANNATLTSSLPTFTWRAASGANLYRIDIALDPTFGAFLGGEVATTRYTPATPLDQGTYYWRVLARDSALNWSGASARWSFTYSLLQSPVPGFVI